MRRYPEERIEVERAGEVIAHHRLRAGKGQTITLPEHVAGLWQRTLAKPAPTATPERSALTATAPAWALPEVEVEMRDLSVYEQVAVGAHAPMLTEVAR